MISRVHRITSLSKCLKNNSNPFPALLKHDTYHSSIRTSPATSLSTEFCIVTVLVKKIELTLNIRWKAWLQISSSTKMQTPCQSVPRFPHLPNKYEPCSSQHGDHVVNVQFLSLAAGLHTINCLLQKACTQS